MASNNKREYVALPYEYLDEMDELDDAEFGRLVRALIRYSMSGEAMTLSGNERFYAKRAMTREDRYRESYEKNTLNKSEAGKAGAAARWGDRTQPDGNSPQTIADDSSAWQTIADDSKPCDRKKSNGKNGYTETKTETETKTKTDSLPPDVGKLDICAELLPSTSTPVAMLPLNDGTEYAVTEEQCHEWAGLYPAVDVIQQLRGMRAWLLANPKRRKTRRGINAFAVNWLSREQDKGRPYTPAPAARSGGGNVFLDMLREEEARANGA